MYDRIRRFTLEIAKRLKDKGLIDNNEDIFYFPVDVLIKSIKNKNNHDDIKQQLNKYKNYYLSYKKFKNPAFIGFETNGVDISNKSSDKIYYGITCSSGVVEGKVRIIRDLSESHKLQEGDILVTEYTDPAWTMLFNFISGIITETGGVLSHAAIISREYGIPSVLGVENITNILKDGQKIVIDGNEGRIIVKD